MKINRRNFVKAGAAGLLVPADAHAGIISVSGARQSNLTPPGGGGGDTLFAADFSNLNANGSNLYNFSNRYAPGSSWTHTHFSSGGYNNGPYARVTMLGGQEQYQLGWTTPTNGESWSVGDWVWFRIGIRFPSTTRWPALTQRGKLKFVLFGNTGTSPQSRVLLYMQPPYDANGALGTKDYGGVEETAGQVLTWARPGYFGESGANDWSDVNTTGEDYTSISPMVNIDGFPHTGRCICLTHQGNSSPPNPGPYGAAPSGGIYWIQIGARSGASGAVEFRSYVNNNTYSTPDGQRTGITGAAAEGLGVNGWNGSCTIGGYCDNDPVNDLAYDLLAFEYGRSFRSDWYPG